LSLLLHLETATTACSVALSKDAKLLALEELNSGYSHAENLVSFCADVLNKSNYTFKDLAAVAVSKGPGSYTGLRIGVSAAKGFCYALNIPLVSVNTLQHMALQVSQGSNFKNALFCPMIDARRMEVYCAVYDSNNEEVQATAAKIITAHSFEELLATKQVVFFGDGAAKCKSFLAENSNALFLDAIYPSAKDMIVLANTNFQKKIFENTAYFEPFYLKDFLLGGESKN
jgi:tRNA threonylcarbamoyladenosine biosynthesis protein TsaB